MVYYAKDLKHKWKCTPISNTYVSTKNNVSGLTLLCKDIP